MVQVMIRLQNHGRKNHPFWWIVVQPKNKNFRGRILEKVGVWSPRKTKTVDRAISVNKYKLKYWLSVGATPTDGAHRLLHFAGLLPKKPVAFGSKFLYTPLKQTYAMQYFHTHRWGLNIPQGANVHHYNKLKQMESILKTKLEIDNMALNEIVRPRDLNASKREKTEYKTDMNTDDISSDDFDFYSRKRNFDIISKKLGNYFDTQYKLYRGNDYKYNNYLRKLDKLSRKQSLDSEGFKEYLDCVQNLNDSKNKVLQNIGQHFLNELMIKQSMKNEIDEIIKLAKNNINNTEEKTDTNEITLNEEEKKKYFNIFLNASVNDKNTILDALNKNFQSTARQVFKVSEENNLTENEFQDIKNLRIAKILIKMRVAILNEEREELEKLIDEDDTVDDSSINSNSNSKSLYKKKRNSINKKTNAENSSENLKEGLKESFKFASIFDNLKTAKFDDAPLFDKDLISEIILRNSDCESYDDLLFNNINNHILNTPTFKKFSSLLFHPEFYGYSNLNNSSEEESNNEIKSSQEKLLQNPNIYLLNNDLIDELINSLMHKLQKKYEVNDIYRDEESLEQFEGQETENQLRRAQMEKSAKELKAKYGNVDLLYANFENPEKYKDIYEFRRVHGAEYSQKYDLKFKKDLRMSKPELKLRKYYTAEEIEEEKAKEEKADRLRERATNEIEAIRLNLPVPEAEKLSEEDENLYNAIKADVRFEIFKHEDPRLSFIPLPEENHPVLNFAPYISIMRRRHKKDPKTPFQDEILALNKQQLRKNIIWAHSINTSRGIPTSRQREIMKRFLDYFGKYSQTLYPDGFRHLETYEIYQSIFPMKSIADYQSELNTFCDFDTFVEICYGSISHYKKLALIGLEFPELFYLTQYFSLYIKSKSTEFITSTVKDAYKMFLVEFEKRNLNFNLIDALEQSASYSVVDKMLPEIKRMLQESAFENNVDQNYVFNPMTFKSMPNLHERGEDLNLNRMGPFMPINPLKAHKANPTFNVTTKPKKIRPQLKVNKVRIYKGFCTVVRRTCEDDASYLH